MPPLEMVWDTEPFSNTLPELLINRPNWVTSGMEEFIRHHREDNDCTTCRLCQQHFTTPRRLRVHVPQQNIATTGTTSPANSGQWSATPDISTTSTNSLSPPSLVSSNTLYLTPFVTNAYLKDFQTPESLPTDPSLNPQDIPNLHHLPLVPFLVRRPKPKWSSSG